MNWHNLLFWRRPAIADIAELATFVDERAAFLMQKGLHEYSRARAGHYAKVLFHESEFVATMERSRWRAYPLGLAMVGEAVDGVFRKHAGGCGPEVADNLRALVLSVLDRYPAPAVLGEAAWREARAELERRLQSLSLHPPKRVIDIAEPYARTYWDLMPIHKEARSPDFSTTHSYLRITLCNIHDELIDRADLTALAAQLRAGLPVPQRELGAGALLADNGDANAR